MHVLRRYIAGSCAAANKDFMACKAANGDPKACVRQGQSVIRCVNAILSKVDSACPKELSKYAVCLDKNSNQFQECRKEQSALEACAGPP